MKHASIIPLIGGETIGQELSFGSRPEWLASYSPFKNNDSHLVNHYGDVPYHLIDEGDKPSGRVDVVNTVCPCAGLSMLSHGYGEDNHNNKWMVETAKYVLGELRPTVFWGENAPNFAGKIGDKVRNEIRKIGRDNGYTMSVYRTKTLLHGGPQVRNRSFYFFWRSSKTPLIGYYNRPHAKIEDVILNAKGNTQREVINKNTPTKDPYYRFILEHMHGGITHRQFFDMMDSLPVRENDVNSYIEKSGYDYKQVGEWMGKNGFDREVEKCAYKYEKLAKGMSIMRRGTTIPKNYIGAFVGHYPSMLTHPHEDRYIDCREAMTIMGLPDSFELLNPVKNINHVCQNVPIQTARDMADEIAKFLNGELEEVDTDYILQSNLSRTHEAETRNSTLDLFIN